jgi:uncharacterized membrane protein
MDKEIVIIVATETAAYEVVKALKQLDAEGSIELYASTVVSKAQDGTMSIKDTRDIHLPWGSALGASSGALIGLVAGPVGVAVGATIGGAVGLAGDLTYSGFSGDFVYDVSASLKPGSHAVCASVWEDWTVPIDVAVAPLGGAVMRQATDDIVAAEIRADQQALKDEWAHFEAEVANAKGDAKAKLEAKRDALRAQEAAHRERLHKRATKLQEKWDAKLASIAEKASKASAEVKARHLRHADKLSRFAATQKESFRELFA